VFLPRILKSEQRDVLLGLELLILVVLVIKETFFACIGHSVEVHICAWIEQSEVTLRKALVMGLGELGEQSLVKHRLLVFEIELSELCA